MLNLTKYIPDHVDEVVFDWNGTLLDDMHYCVTVTNSCLADHGLAPLTLERYRQLFRFPVKDYYGDLGFDFATVPFETVSNRWMSHYKSSVLKVDLFEQSEELIRGLSQDGVRCSILSAAMESDIHELLSHHRIDDCFHEVFGLDHGHATSKTQRGRELVERLGKPAKNVMLIGDTDHDFEVADTLGMEVMILADGHQDYGRLKSLSCQVLPTRYVD